MTRRLRSKRYSAVAVTIVLVGFAAGTVAKPLPHIPREPPAEILHDPFNGANGMPAHVYRVVFSPMGRYFMAAGDAGGRSPIRVYDGRTGKLVSRLLPDENAGWSCGRFSYDDKKVVFWGSTSSAVYVWEAATGRKLFKLEGHKAPIVAAAFSPDGRRIVSGGQDNCLCIWDAVTGKLLGKLTDHAGACAGVYSPDGKWIVSCGADKTVRAWDAATLKEAWKQTEQTPNNYWTNNEPFTPIGDRLFSYGSDGSIRVWETATGKAIARLAAAGEPQGAQFLHDGKQLASWSKDKKLHVWDVAGGKEVSGFDLGENLMHEPDNVTISPNGRLVLTGHTDRTVRVRELATGKELFRYKLVQQMGTRSLAFGPDSHYAASGSFRGWVYLWRLP